jgi:hypothetical protein
MLETNSLENFIYYTILCSIILFFHIMISKYLENIFRFSMFILYYTILFTFSKFILSYNCEYFEKYIGVKICKE